MLSRFSSLLAYVAVGLVISAAATPMAPSSDYDGVSNSPSPSHPDSSYSSPISPKYPADKPYAKPYAEEKPKEQYPEEKRPEGMYPKDKSEAKPPYPQEKPYPKTDGKASGDHPQAQYPSQKQPDAKGDGKGQSYGDRPKYNNQCNVENQVCCNGSNEVSHSKLSYLSISLLKCRDSRKTNNTPNFFTLWTPTSE